MPARFWKNNWPVAQPGLLTNTALPRQVFEPDLAVTLNTPPAARPISASYVLSWTLMSSTASVDGTHEARFTKSVIDTPSIR